MAKEGLPMRYLLVVCLLAGCVTPRQECERDHPTASEAQLRECAARVRRWREAVANDLRKANDEMRADQERRALEQRVQDLEREKFDREWNDKYGR